MKLDKSDIMILRILQQDAPITNKNLAEQVGLSAGATLQRVRQLEAAKIINSYHASLNEDLLGLKIKAMVLVSLTRQRENAMQNFAKKLMLLTKSPNVIKLQELMITN